MPTPEHIIEKQLYNLADRLERVDVNEDEINKYLPEVLRKLSWLSTEDLLKRVLSLEFNRLLNYYKDAPKIDFIDDKPKKSAARTKKPPLHAPTRKRPPHGRARHGSYLCQCRKADGFFAKNLIDMLNRCVEGARVDVGRIDLLPGYSLSTCARPTPPEW